jgi:hypothetical protein
VKVEFHRPDDEQQTTVATVAWDGGRVGIESDDEDIGAQLAHAFRPTPVVTDDAAYRSLGTSGPVMIQPGDLVWFRAAAKVRASAETGLVPRFVPEITEGGFDPAAGYRTFEEQIERLTVRGHG